MILAIETSCDETSAAIVDRDFRILSNVVYSQIEDHERFGGVVPEIASRRHLELLPEIVTRALGDRCPTQVAVTRGPGLIGALLVGVTFAKAFALARGLPVYGIHHIEGHLHAVLLERKFPPPFLALVVSGGHTELIHVRAWGDYERVARTTDDAAGEAFDKAAALLALGFPGGPKLAALADSAGPERIHIAGDIMAGRDDFSFSGLKTALRLLVGKHEPAILAASFQDAVVKTLVQKTERALKKSSVDRLLLTGGVAANRSLRAAMSKLAEARGVEFAVPSAELCTDNAAMIGAAALTYPREAMKDDESAMPMISLSEN